MRYSLKIKESARRELGRILKPDRERIIRAIDALPDNPFRGTALKGELTGLRRLRVGSYRIIYEVQNDVLVILVVRVAHRSKAYRQR